MTGTRSGAQRTSARSRRRSRQPVRRVRSVRFGLTEEEYGEVGEAAAQAGMAKGAYAAHATLAAARGLMNPADAPARQALTELIRAAGLVRRIGVNLNQAVAKLNATGQRLGGPAAVRGGVRAAGATAGRGGRGGAEAAAVIGKVLRGQRPAGLIRYLYGPGRREEHRDPHLVAGWRDPAELEPALRPDGRRDFRRLTGLLTQPHAALGPRGFETAGVALRGPGRAGGPDAVRRRVGAPGPGHHGPHRARAARPGRRGGPLDRGPARPGSHPHRRDAGPPGRGTTAVLERLLPRPRSLPGRRGTARAAAHRPGRPHRGSPPDPRGAREGPPPGTPRSAPDHAPAGGRHRGGRGGQRGRVLRPPPRGGRAGPRPVQHPEPGPGHRLRRRPGRRHGPRRGTGVVRRREARGRPEPAQAPRPLGRRQRASPAARPVHRRRSGTRSGSTRPARRTTPGSGSGGAPPPIRRPPPTRPGRRRTRCTRRPPRWAAG